MTTVGQRIEDVLASPSAEATPGLILCEGVSKLYPAGRQLRVVPVPSLLRRGRRTRLETADGKGAVPVADDDDDDLAEERELLEEEEPAAAETRRATWALRDVSLEVAPGSSLALLGANGAGKSTLLKVLARVTPPTEGRAVVCGRMAPLFGLTTAFLQPDRTAPSNIMLVADLFDVPRDVAERCTPEVLEFAEVEKQAHLPLKTYSPGQYARLAMSIVLNLEPDVILADRSIAVGDKAFRHSCLERLETLARSGVTLVLATDDSKIAHRFCDEAVWLSEGRIVSRGPTAAIAAEHERVPAKEPADSVEPEFDAAITDAGIFDMDGRPAAYIPVRAGALVEIRLGVARSDVSFRCVVVLSGGTGKRFRFVQPYGYDVDRAGEFVVSLLLPPGLLEDDVYTARIGARITRDGERSRVLRKEAFAFEAHETVDSDESPEDVEDTAAAPVWEVASA